MWDYLERIYSWVNGRVAAGAVVPIMLWNRYYQVISIGTAALY